jgi:hypothetical protein
MQESISGKTGNNLKWEKKEKKKRPIDKFNKKDINI